MRAARRGVTLVELLLALAIIAGPALYVLDSIRTSTQSARLDAERVAALLLLSDLHEIVRSEGLASLKQLTGAGPEPLRALARQRVVLYAGPDAERTRRSALALCDTLTVKLDERAGAVDGLASVTLAVEPQRGGPVTLARWLRTHVSAKGTRPRSH